MFPTLIHSSGISKNKPCGPINKEKFELITLNPKIIFPTLQFQEGSWVESAEWPIKIDGFSEGGGLPTNLESFALERQIFFEINYKSQRLKKSTFGETSQIGRWCWMSSDQPGIPTSFWVSAQMKMGLFRQLDVLIGGHQDVVGLDVLLQVTRLISGLFKASKPDLLKCYSQTFFNQNNWIEYWGLGSDVIAVPIHLLRFGLLKQRPFEKWEIDQVVVSKDQWLKNKNPKIVKSMKELEYIDLKVKRIQMQEDGCICG